MLMRSPIGPPPMRPTLASIRKVPDGPVTSSTWNQARESPERATRSSRASRAIAATSGETRAGNPAPDSVAPTLRRSVKPSVRTLPCVTYPSTLTSSPGTNACATHVPSSKLRGSRRPPMRAAIVASSSSPWSTSTPAPPAPRRGLRITRPPAPNSGATAAARPGSVAAKATVRGACSGTSSATRALSFSVSTTGSRPRTPRRSASRVAVSRRMSASVVTPNTSRTPARARASAIASGSSVSASSDGSPSSCRRVSPW